MTNTKPKSDRCWSRLPVYKSGGRLTAEQLASEQADSDLRERLLNLSLHGTGVVHGMNIRVGDDGKPKVRKNAIHVGCGLALDRWGRTLYLDDCWLRFGEIIGHEAVKEGCYTLSVHYAETSEGESWDPCEDTVAWRHRCVVFTLKEGCESACTCPKCLPDPSCDPRRVYVCERTGMKSNKRFQDPDLKGACETPPALVRCGPYHYDPEAGIPLACVEICRLNEKEPHCDPEFGFCPCASEEPPCDDDEKKTAPKKGQAQQAVQASAAVQQAGKIPSDRWPEEEDDCETEGTGDCAQTDCDMRPVAYRAPLLYELINDTDVYLPKVKSFSWEDSALGDWKTRMQFDEFVARVEACTFVSKKNDEGELEDICTGDPNQLEGFYVEFDRPVNPATLHPLSVLMQVYIRENRTTREGAELVVNWKEFRVPLSIKPVLDPRDQSCAIGVRLCISKSWLDYIVGDIRACAVDGQYARVEITLRGQAIRDKCGCMLDARPHDLDCRDHCGRKTGQARPGGDWISVFRVQGPDDPPRYAAPDQNQPPDSGGNFETTRTGERSHEQAFPDAKYAGAHAEHCGKLHFGHDRQ